jgi:hypothetical protein
MSFMILLRRYAVNLKIISRGIIHNTLWSVDWNRINVIMLRILIINVIVRNKLLFGIMHINFGQIDPSVVFQNIRAWLP